MLGALSLGASLLLPIGFASVIAATIGAITVVAGLLTLVVLLVGRVAGLHSRSRKVQREGRAKVIFPGSRPPQMHLRRVGDQVVASPVAAPIELAATTIDLTTSERERAAVG